MNETRSEGLAGINFLRDKAWVAEVKRLDGQPLVNRITQGQLDTHFNFDVFNNRSLVSRFSDNLNQIIKGSDIKAKRAAFSLHRSFVLIKRSPIDSNFSDEDLREQVSWEIEQFILSPRDEYIVDYQRLISVGEVLIVAVRTSIVNYLKDIFSATDLKLEAVDVDIFAALRALKANQYFGEADKVALVDVGEQGLNFSILIGGEYYLSQEVLYPAEATEFGGANLISKELRRLILDNKLGESIENLNGIFLYGELVEDDVLEELQNTHDVRIDRANPFRRLRLSPDVSSDPLVRSRPETFMVCTGTALKRLQNRGGRVW
jgi:Tfp pilus assembly PilM family ATPase